jgi:hypothetical protein
MLTDAMSMQVLGWPPSSQCRAAIEEKEAQIRPTKPDLFSQSEQVL